MNGPTAARQLLRSGIPRLTPRLRAGTAQQHQIRQISNKEDLGGPLGQEPPPKKPAGPEALKRNGVLYAGISLIALAGYAYMTQPKETSAAADKAIRAGERAKERGREELANTKEEIVGGMKKMSGRGSDGQKGFRSE